jgi:hypothetical protein
VYVVGDWDEGTKTRRKGSPESAGRRFVRIVLFGSCGDTYGPVSVVVETSGGVALIHHRTGLEADNARSTD